MMRPVSQRPPRVLSVPLVVEYAVVQGRTLPSMTSLGALASLTLAWARAVSPRGNECWLRPLWFPGWVGVNVSEPHVFIAGIHAEAVGWCADPGGTSSLSLPASLPWVSDVYPWVGFFVVCKPLTITEGRALLKPQTSLPWYVHLFALLQQNTPAG